LRFRSKSGDITPAEQAHRKLAKKLGVVLFFSEETVAAVAPTTQDDTTGRARDPSGGAPVRNVRANTAPASGACAADARAAPPEHGQGDGADAARGVGAMDGDADAARGVGAMDGGAMDSQSTAHTSRTRTAPAPLDPSAGWSEYDRGRVGERHVATREVSYEELFALHGDLDFYREAYSQLRSIVDLLADPATIECAVVLATTLSECLDEDLQDDDNDDDTAEPADADAATGVRATAEAEGGSSATAAPPASRRVRLGRELRLALKEIAQTERKGKTKAAHELVTKLESGATSSFGSRITNSRVNELADLLFCVGDLKQTRSVVEKFMQIPEMRQLLPEHMRSSAKDAETKEIMINEAKVFLTELLGTKGRRTDVNRNAHLAGLTALLPSDLFKQQRGRSAMRVLGVRHATATKAPKAKGAMQEDAAKGWTLITPSQHADRADYSQHMDSWWHSDEASTEDNAHKRPVRIYHEPDPVTGELKYELHYPREQNDSDNAMLALWRGSVACEAMKRDTERKKDRKAVSAANASCLAFAVAV